jgi:long-chain acyl-CoA synthetase
MHPGDDPAIMFARTGLAAERALFQMDKEGFAMSSTREIEALLTAPGGGFDVVVEDVLGVATKVYAQRMKSMRDLFELGGARGDETFIVYGDRTISFGAFVTSCRAAAAELAAGPACIRRGDRVAVAAANCPEWCQTFWSTVPSGAVLVGLNGWWKSDELLYGITDSGSKALVADRGRYERIAGLLGACPELRVVYLIDAEPGELVSPGGSVELRHVRELFEGAAPATVSDPDATEEDDPAVIFYTSGTTGRPKGAVSSHRGMIANLQDTFYLGVVRVLLGAGSDEGGRSGPVQAAGQMSSLLTSPLFHVSGCHSNLVVSFAAGIRLVIPPGRFDPEVVLATIERERIAVWAAVPTMVWRVVDDPRRHDFDLSSVTQIAYGGSPSAGELQRKVRETFPNVSSIGNAYGLTETSSVATVNGGPDALERPESVGRPLPVVDVKVVEPDCPTVEIADAAGLPAGEVGEVCIKGPILMLGYWNKPAETAEVMARGWFRSGDLGRIDLDGFVYITDRAKDMIIRGGENVYCVEIENRLVEHPKIAEAAVVGVAHPTLGEEVKAIVRLEPGEAMTAEEVRSFVGETLANFKVPAYVEFSKEPLPRNPSGKVLKQMLRGSKDSGFAETL